MSDPTTIINLFTGLLSIATRVGMAVSALFLAWAGFLYMTASGSPRRMESAKDVCTQNYYRNSKIISVTRE